MNANFLVSLALPICFALLAVPSRKYRVPWSWQPRPIAIFKDTLGGHLDSRPFQVLKFLPNRNVALPCHGTQGKSTALHHAATYGHVEAVKILLGSGAVPQAEDMQGRRPGDSFENDVRGRLVALTKYLLVGQQRTVNASHTCHGGPACVFFTHRPRAFSRTNRGRRCLERH